MHMHRASHALSKIQYVHASNLGILKFGVLKNLFIHYEHGTKANIGGAKMANNRNASTGISFKAIGRQIGYHYTVVSRPVRKHTQTNTVKDLPRYRRPHVTSQREDRALHRLVRWMPFAASPVLKRQ